jgi:hypothetical protein
MWLCDMIRLRHPSLRSNSWLGSFRAPIHDGGTMARLIRLCALLTMAYPLPATGQSGTSPELALGIGLAATLVPMKLRPVA